MQASNPYTPSSAPVASTTPRPVPGRRIVDAPTRTFHALFVLCFAGAYLSGDSEAWRALHVALGYSMAGLLVFRVAYGLIGPRQARLGVMARKTVGVAAWWRDLRAAGPSALTSKSTALRGGNLGLALGIVAMLALAVPLLISGWAFYEDLGGEWLAEIHELMGNLMLAGVLAHLGLLLGLSVLARRNRVLPMWNGRTPGPGPDLVQADRRWLAGLMVAALVAWLAWSWQQAPDGLGPAGGWQAAFQHDGHDDDD
ncbi:MAG: cytochrome b/b6 domain-containing protein [Rubrivivax sp.]